MPRWFWQNRVTATSEAEAAAKLAAKAEAKGYRVVRVRCHPVPWLVDEWEGVCEIEGEHDTLEKGGEDG